MQTISKYADEALNIAKSSSGKITVCKAIRLVARKNGVSARDIGRHLNMRSRFVRKCKITLKSQQPTPLSNEEKDARQFYGEFVEQRNRGFALAQEMSYRRTFELTGQTDW